MSWDFSPRAVSLPRCPLPPLACPLPGQGLSRRPAQPQRRGSSRGDGGPGPSASDLSLASAHRRPGSPLPPAPTSRSSVLQPWPSSRRQVRGSLCVDTRCGRLERSRDCLISPQSPSPSVKPRGSPALRRDFLPHHVCKASSCVSECVVSISEGAQRHPRVLIHTLHSGTALSRQPPRFRCSRLGLATPTEVSPGGWVPREGAPRKGGEPFTCGEGSGAGAGPDPGKQCASWSQHAAPGDD